MDKSKTPISRYKKLAALLVGVFTLCNFIFLFPVYASGTPQQVQAPAGGMASSFCIPIPLIFPCKSPTPTPTPTKCIPIPLIHPCKSPTPTETSTPGATGTPGQGPSPTPSTTPTPPQLSLAGSFTLTASEIVGTDAHLNITDVLHPVLTFSAVTIQGMRLTHLSITLSATGTVSGSGVAIKTSVFHDLVTALSSFTDKADLLKLLVGATVKTLVMENVTLQIDRYIQIDSLTVNGLLVN
jgi:hypothetical protein